MLTVGVIGATGYAGSQLVALLAQHPEVSLEYLASHSYHGQRFGEIYPSLIQSCNLELQEEDVEQAAKACDVLFLALPHGMASSKVNQSILDQCVVIDLGADYRLADVATYSQWYQTEHPSSDLLSQSVYGLCELHREAIREASLIANPGCYPTSATLTIAPLLAANLIDPSTLIIDSASGTSGAGRSAKIGSLFCEVNENYKAYGVTDHRHTPEIEQELSAILGSPLVVQFTPHLVPMNRGILSTCYAKLLEGVGEKEIAEAYHDYYRDEPFIRLMDSHLPETRFVSGTNVCAIGWRVDERTGRVIALGAIDNLIKGASGQAVQNMNIRFGFEETMGLPVAVATP
jgi:N-acetyl-gamma-glutamyl-phosphate reductase